jgi:hypothetical protein
VSGNVTGKDLTLSPVPANTYTVSGTVSTSNGGSVAGVVAALWSEGGSTGKIADTGANGNYAINGVAAGTYTIKVSLAGYVSGEITAIAVSDNDVTGKDLTLSPVPANTYTISGTISTSDEVSAAGAVATLWSEGVSTGKIADTGADGNYAISGVAAGTYTVKVSLAGYASGETTAIAVSDSNVTGNNLTLQKQSGNLGSGNQNGSNDQNGSADPFTITGLIVTSNEGSAEGAKLELRESGSTTIYGDAAYAVSNGTFSVDTAAVPAGKYVVLKVTLNGYQTYETDEFLISEYSITLFRVENKTITAFVDGDKIVLNPSNFTVSGVISTDYPVGTAAGATVDLKNKSGGQVATATTNASGQYSIPNVPKSDGYYILVTLAGYKQDNSNNRSESFSVSTGNVTQNLTLQANRYDVEGIIYTSASGARANSPTVQLKQDGSVKYTAGTYSNGEYEFEDVLAGTYTLAVSYTGFAPVTVSLTVSGNTEKDVTLEPVKHSVSGTITLDGGSGSITAVSITLSKQNGVNFSKVEGFEAHPQSNGSYTIANLEPGTYNINAALAGYTTKGSGSFTVSNADIPNINLTLPLVPVYSISGTITLGGGSGTLTAVSVQLRQGGTDVGSPVNPASGSGAYTITGVDPGSNYTVRASLDGYVSSTTASFTVDNTVTGKNLTLEPALSSNTITGKNLIEALNYIKNLGVAGDYTIELGADETASAAYYNIDGFATPVTITVDGKNHNVTFGAYSSTSYGHLTVQSGVTLVTKNVTLTGNTTSSNTIPLVRVRSGGTFKMEAGTTLTGNKASSGGGVYVDSGAVFVMNGGTITGNIASMGHGVYVVGSMSMTGGSVTGNAHSSNADGANDVAVYAASTGTGSLTLSGNAQPGRIWLRYASNQLGTITIDSDFTGSATIDLSSNTDFKGKQILKGNAVSSSYTKFTLGVYRANFTSGAGTALAGSIDSNGYFN